MDKIFFLLAAGAGAYMFFRKDASGASGAPADAPSFPTAAGFPLAKGSRNKFVENVQRALLAKGGVAAEMIRKSGGADGIFGDGTLRALLAAGFPAVVQYADYERITGHSANSAQAGADHARKVYAVATAPRTTLYSYALKFMTPFGTVPANTFLGKATGNGNGSHSQLQVTLGGRQYTFWALNAEISLYSEAEYNEKRGRFLDKSYLIRTKIMNAQ